MPTGDMNSEEARLKTFQGSGWPVMAPVDPRDLAAAGFYYIGPGDKVGCFACRGCLNNWEGGDVPLHEHRRLYPKCPFILGNSCDNIAIENGEIHATDSIPSVRPHYTNSAPPDILVPSKLGIPATGRIIHPMDIVTSSTPTPDVVRTCRHPEYAMENHRYLTFRSWPSRSPINPLVLARAGFFYTGEQDKVTCFYCGGSLNQWKANDDPWVEHARSFGRCEWLLQQKGPFFLQHVMKTTSGVMN